MKKLLFIALAVMTVGCHYNEGRDFSTIYDTCIIDSCEYVLISGFTDPTHKGNCKYCQERRKQEMRELINGLKGGE